jgi:hypothetical protein
MRKLKSRTEINPLDKPLTMYFTYKFTRKSILKLNNTSHEENISTKQPKESPQTRLQDQNEHQRGCEGLESSKSQRKEEINGLG